MRLKREHEADVFHVEARHDAIHRRLVNWASWVKVRGYPAMSPMFRALGVKSNSRHWHMPVIIDTVDMLDAQLIEKAVGKMPEMHAEALRWFYVFQHPPAHVYRRKRGYTWDTLKKICTDARTMLDNRVN